MWEDLLKDWSFKKEDFKIGIVAGLFIFAAILYLISSGTLNFKASWTKDEFNLAPDMNSLVLGFPEYKNPKEFSFYITNISGECISTKIELGNGLDRSGIYCQGDYIYVLNRALFVERIFNSNEVEKPIKISVYKIFNIGELLKILLILLPVMAIWYKVSKVLEKRSKREASKKRIEIAKKFKVKPEDLDELQELLEDED